MIAAVFPLHLPGWQYFSPRFLHLAVAIGIALVGVERLEERRRQWFAVFATIVALLGLERSRALHASIYTGCADAFSGLRLPLKRTKVQLAFTLDPHCGVPADPESSPTPYLSPLEHVGSLYAANHGGTLPSMFLGSPSIHAFMPRELGPDEDLPIPPGEGLPAVIARDEVARRHALNYVAAHAAFYESFLLFGARPAEIDAVLAQGFVARWRQDTFLIAEARGCPMDLRIANPPPSGSIEVGYAPWPAVNPIWVKQFPLPPGPSAAAFTIAISHSICGDVWIRPIWRSAAPPERAARCEGSTPDGRIILSAKVDAEIHCRLEAPAP